MSSGADGARVVVTAALTGPLASRDEHPGLPITPEEIAMAATAASEAGAAIVHVHLRDAHGRPTADTTIAARHARPDRPGQ